MVSLWPHAQYSTRSNSATINFTTSKTSYLDLQFTTIKSFNRVLNVSYVF